MLHSPLHQCTPGPAQLTAWYIDYRRGKRKIINPENETEPENLSESESQPSEPVELQIPAYIGRTEFGSKSKMLLLEKRFSDQIQGLIREDNAASVSPGDILVIESLKHKDKIFASVTKMEMNKKNTATNFESFS